MDTSFILTQFSKDPITAKKQYMELIRRKSDNENEDMEFKHERAEYRSERKALVRNFKPKDVIEFAASYTKQDKRSINIKYIKKTVDFKALSALLLRGVCDMKQKYICSGNRRLIIVTI